MPQKRHHTRGLRAVLISGAAVAIAGTAGALVFGPPGPAEEHVASPAGPVPDTAGVGPLDPLEATVPPPVDGDRPPAKAIERGTPVRIRIGGIGVSAPIKKLGLTKGRKVQIPPLSKPNLAGWYRHSPTPGELGPSVILGHVDTHAGPAVFSRLGTLRRGDTIEVDRRDDSTAVFSVDRLEQVRKDRFPSGRVYGDIAHAGLRLVTCGGRYDRRDRSYTDNVIIYAHLVKTRRI